MSATCGGLHPGNRFCVQTREEVLVGSGIPVSLATFADGPVGAFAGDVPDGDRRVA